MHVYYATHLEPADHYIFLADKTDVDHKMLLLKNTLIVQLYIQVCYKFNLLIKQSNAKDEIVKLGKPCYK
jgi:hypothetical protein